MGEARLAEARVDLFSDTGLPEALWADLAKVSRWEGPPVATLGVGGLCLAGRFGL